MFGNWPSEESHLVTKYTSLKTTNEAVYLAMLEVPFRLHIVCSPSDFPQVWCLIIKEESEKLCKHGYGLRIPSVFGPFAVLFRQLFADGMSLLKPLPYWTMSLRETRSYSIVTLLVMISHLRTILLGMNPFPLWICWRSYCNHQGSYKCHGIFDAAVTRAAIVPS